MTNLPFRHKALTFSLGVFLIFLIFIIFWFLLSSPSGASSTKVITLRRGMPLKKIATILEQEGIIRNKHFFTAMTTLLGKKGKIKAGEYEFHTRMLPLKVLHSLVKGQVKRHLVTIPEGFTLSQIAQTLQDLDIVGRELFLQKASSPAMIASLGLSDSPPSGALSTLEGFLFPETYHLIKEMPAEEVIKVMVGQFRKVFGTEFQSRASQIGISQREVVILASLIEKETLLSEEKPLISAVLHNRLKMKMPLQSDPTVIYGIKNFDGNLTKEHLMKPTPYNTYLFGGLPPTPICNPGKESIRAALYPASVNYLYFVSKNDGTHYFSSSIEEHNQAVWKYQKFKKNLTRK
ncbi:MAG: endolytic transglycosylase MltG [Thermodesulfobacteriota bacterium]